MKHLILVLCILVAAGSQLARAAPWQPAAGHVQVPIWPGAVPDAHPAAGPEDSTVTDTLVAGKPFVFVDRVAVPTMTVYAPAATNTGAAVVVFPGGGYIRLAIDLEGTEVCDWLTAKGITCVLLKYRVPHSGDYYDAACNCRRQPKAPMALEDVQRTVGLVRFHAAEWHIDPHKIGVLGFSAGGHLAAQISNQFAKRLYTAVDAADRESCRPDFAVAIYPGHLSVATDSVALKPAMLAHITAQASPTFLLQNEDDDVDRVEDSLSYYFALKKVGVPVEMHLYAHGGHAFGLRRTALPVTAWPRLVETWLGSLGMIPRRADD